MGRIPIYTEIEIEFIKTHSIDEICKFFPNKDRNTLIATKRYWSSKMERQPQPKADPKVLVYDIETSPNLGYVYGKYQQDVMAFKQEWDLLGFAYKWLGKRAIDCYAQDEYTEEELVTKIHDLLDEADVVIAHNGDRFDQKMSNTKFIEYGLDPPSPYRSIDTLKIAKRYFRFNSNRLGDLGERLGVGSKVQLGGFAVWLACMNGDQKAWNKMKVYNKQDVRLLEEIYYKMLPWIDNHPPMNVYTGKETACPKCGSEQMQQRGNRKVNKTTTVQRYQCQGCGGWSQSRYSDKTNVKYTN